MKRVALLLSILSLAAAPAHAQWSTDALSAPRGFLGAATVGNYALFAGGALPSGQSDRVDIYDAVSGSWSTATLTVKRRYVDATVVGQYALFAGGWVQGGGDSAVVDVFDSQTMTWSTATLSQPRKLMGATSVGGKAFFAGGATGFLFGSPTPSDRVDIYDSAVGAPSNPAAWSTHTLTQARFYMAATTAGSQALFAGGTDFATAVYDNVDIYDDSTGVWSTATLSLQRAQLAATSVGTKAYFAGGGDTPNTLSAVVDVYDAQTGAWSTLAPLSQPRGELTAASIGNQALFAGGHFDPITGAASAVVDVLNTGTGQWSSAVLSQARWGLCSTTVGGRVIFAGGIYGATSPLGPTAVVDIYEPVGVSYCTAGTTTNGCNATMGYSGTPSVSQSSGFTVSVNSVEGAKQGIIFYGNLGPVATPWGVGGNSFLCVKSPTQRAGTQNTGGTANTCNGAMSLDLLAYLAANPTALGNPFSAGQQCWIQGWFRDPPAVKTTNLSDGLEVTFQP